MQDLPRPGIEPVSPALAGGFSTTGPPWKSSAKLFYARMCGSSQRSGSPWDWSTSWPSSFYEWQSWAWNAACWHFDSRLFHSPCLSLVTVALAGHSQDPGVWRRGRLPATTSRLPFLQVHHLLLSCPSLPSGSFPTMCSPWGSMPGIPQELITHAWAFPPSQAPAWLAAPAPTAGVPFNNPADPWLALCQGLSFQFP